MNIIIGLGNPGEKYSHTRHNAGFLALDNFSEYAERKGAQNLGTQKKFQSAIREIIFSGKSGAANLNSEKILLAYPQTFMNESGAAVKELLGFYKLSTENILVLHDDIDLPLGTIKFTESSGSAGHNGIKSIIENLGTQQFRRIRIGIETRTDKNIPPTDAFVLQNFSEEELSKIPFEEISRIIHSKLNL